MTSSQYPSGGTDASQGGQQATGGGNWNYYSAALKDINRGLGTYYDAISRKYALRSNALTMEYEGTIADINARAAASDAEAIAANGRYEQLQVGLVAAQDRAAIEAQNAASGVQAGYGSAGEAVASRMLSKELDQSSVALNTSRNLAAARSQMVSQQNAALLARTAASNARRTSRAISRSAAFHSGLFGG